MPKNADPTFDVGFLLSQTEVTARFEPNFDHSCCGRDDAHQRIDLYPVEGDAFAP